MGSDSRHVSVSTAPRTFQSTLPAWEATIRPHSRRSLPAHFNPRFPRGKRLLIWFRLISCDQFQSTLPAWEATEADVLIRDILKISIHASRVGSDGSETTHRAAMLGFQSTLPAWEATAGGPKRESRSAYFNPRFPRGKRRPSPVSRASPTVISIHASRVGSDYFGAYRQPPNFSISIHASRVGSDP